MKVVDFSHLRTVGETYWQHLYWCLYSVAIFAVMIFLALVHGIFPFLLANIPDLVMISYLRNFRKRRTETGQAERLPE